MNMKMLWQMNRILIIRALLSVTGVSLATLALPFVVGHVGVSSIAMTFVPEQFLADWSVVLGYIIAFAFFSAFRVFSFGALANRVGGILRQYGLSQLIRRYDSQQDVAGLLANIQEIEWVIETSVSQFIRNSFVSLGGIIMMCYFSWFLTLCIVGLIPLVVLPIMLLLRYYRKVSGALKEVQESRHVHTMNVMEYLLPIWFYNRCVWAMRKLQAQDALIERMRGTKLWLRAILTFLLISWILLMLFVIFMVAFYQQSALGLSANQMLQFALFVFLVGLSGSGAGELSLQVSRARTCFQEIQKMGSVNEDTYEGGDDFQSLSVCDVRVEHDGVAVLDGINFQVNKGEKIAIVGISGSGKSSLLRVILGLDSPAAGQVMINNRISADQSSRWRSYFGLLLKHPPLLLGSLRDNLTLGHTGVEDAVYQQGIARVKLEAGDFLNGSMEQSMSEASSGQKQRLQTLCAINQGRAVLVLDEVTSQLDLDTQRAVHDLLLAVDGTVIFATHQVDFIERADRVLFLHNGCVRADGALGDISRTCPAIAAIIDGADK